MSSIVWSHCLCSGRMLKSSLVNIDSNPLMQLDRVKGVLHASEVRRASAVSFWEVMEVAHISFVVDSERILVMKSLSSCSYSTLQVRTRALSSSKSSAYSGGGPDQQMLRALVSILFHDACFFYITRHLSHRGGHWFICTFPVCQLTSGLWSLSQV